MYDYLIVGTGFFGSVFAFEAKRLGKKVLVIDKRDHIGGNSYTKTIEGIDVHVYGAHIFHTSNERVWRYVNDLAEFKPFINTPIANYKGELYNLPFNMHTFRQLWNIVTPKEAKEKIESQRLKLKGKPKNLEEQALSLVGPDVYEKLIKSYTEKQWGKKCQQLPASIIKRLPLRFTFNNNYFNDKYQGIPIRGYTEIFEKLLENIEVRLNSNYFDNPKYYDSLAKTVVYTGPIDRFYNYQFGELEYRSLRFEHQILDEENYQGIAVMNYTDSKTPYTRIIEHKHFLNAKSDKTIITKEYSLDWDRTKEAYYSINDENNQRIFNKYKSLADREKKYLFGGRLADYKYYDMHQVIEKALNLVDEVFYKP